MQLGLTAVVWRVSSTTRVMTSPRCPASSTSCIGLAGMRPHSSSSNSSSSSTGSSNTASSSSSSVPVCPTEPGPEDCCQSGCENCVWEVYRQELRRYTDYMQAHHPAHTVPKQKAAKQQMVEASIDAFEQLERQLQQQQQQQR